MSIIFIIGTLALISFLYWSAYQSEKMMRTIEVTGNLLLSIPEFIFKLVLLGLCMGLVSSLTVANAEKYVGWPSDNPSLDVVIGTVLGLVVQFFVSFTSVIAIRIFGTSIYSPQVMKSVTPKNQREWFLIIIPLLLAVAIEELLFRGLLIGGFSLVINPWVMAVASSLIFGIMHSPQGTLGIILTAVVGFIFATAFIITNSLVVVITAHFVVNFLQILRAKEDLAWYERFQKAPRPSSSNRNLD
jgi:membrane protease YdiL (CAAX protease family)